MQPLRRIEDMPLAYRPGNALRVRVAGDLSSAAAVKQPR